jgi:UTP--glucose-1-phosphate uridylyltransferase
MQDEQTQERITKALIPVAGLGRRFLPQSQAIPKSMLPVITPEGRLVPLLHLQIKQALEAGIERVALVVSPWDEAVFRNHFTMLDPEHEEKIKLQDENMRDETAFLESIASQLDYIVQHEPHGLGHAVNLADAWCGGEPVLLILGDHVFRSTGDRSCFQQLLDPTVSVHLCRLGISRETFRTESYRGYAVVDADPEDPERFRIKEILYGSAESLMSGERNDTKGGREYWSLLGAAVLTRDVFSVLREMVAEDIRSSGEIQLSEALDVVLQKHGMEAVAVSGGSLEMGNAMEYLTAFSALT